MVLGLKYKKAMGIVSVIALAAFPHVSSAMTNTNVPDNQKASLSVFGSGVAPNIEISLSTGPKQTLTTQSDSSGNFMFSNLGYASFSNLKFTLDIPPNTKTLAQKLPANHLELFYDPRGAIARLTGNIGKSGMLTLNLKGADESNMQIAGQEGFVNLQASTDLPLATGKSELVASIVNVGEVCCPNMSVPAPPVTLVISSTPIPEASNVEPMKQPVVVPKQIPNVVTPPSVVPSQPLDEKPQEQPKKKKIPYIVQGAVHFDTRIIVDENFAAAASFPASAYENTYVGGIKKIADSFRNAITSHVAALGAMMDARNLMDSLRSIQNSTVQTMKDYTPSDAVCRFGTLSRSLAVSEAIVDKNRLAFSKAMMDRQNQQLNSVYGEPLAGANDMLQDFKGKYCESVDNNGFLGGYCAAATATSDLLYNRDVDFTRVFDVPLTLNADFADGAAVTNEQQSLFSLFDNLSMTPPYITAEGEPFNPNKNMLTTQDMRAINAAREVAGNSFGALVAEKVKSTSESTAYMKAILTELGVSAADATKLIGDNPSYFAQMEIMSKKLFQNPEFYANLYDSPANIDRQRVAMKAIELQQNRDFLESLRRREMLLSVLLNMKLRTDTGRANTSGTTTVQ